MSRSTLETYVARDGAQQAAVASPLRLEILGQFLTRDGLSIREVAKRMGRSPGSLYHHFHRLESVGLLRRVGERPSGKRKEALYLPVAPRIALPATSATGRAAARRTVAAAFRMAERDLAAALESPRARTTGRHRNTHAVRVHARLTPATLAEINRHLEAIERILGREAARREVPGDATELCSLTVALLPLRGRRPAGTAAGPPRRKGRRR